MTDVPAAGARGVAQPVTDEAHAPTSPIGYVAPDGTHHPCEAWAHKACARAICRALGLKREPTADDDWRAPWLVNSGDDVLDPEQELDRRGYVRVQSSDRDDPTGVSFTACHHDPAATVTDAQKSWLRVHGYKRWLRDMVERLRNDPPMRPIDDHPPPPGDR